MDYMFLTEYGFFYIRADADESIKKYGEQNRTCITVLVIKDFKLLSGLSDKSLKI